MTDFAYGGELYRPELAPTTPDPAPLSLPIEDDGGELPRDFPQTDPAADARQTGTASSGPLTVDPVPLIGAIPFGGVVLQASQLVLAQAGQQGSSQRIGITGAQRPQGTVIRLYVSADTWVTTGPDQLAAGYVLTAAMGPTELPVRELWLQNPSGAAITVTYLVIGYPVQAS